MFEEFACRLNLSFLVCPNSNQHERARKFFILVKARCDDIQTFKPVSYLSCSLLNSSLRKKKMLWEWTLRTRRCFRLISRNHAEIKKNHLLPRLIIVSFWIFFASIAVWCNGYSRLKSLERTM